MPRRHARSLSLIAAAAGVSFAAATGLAQDSPGQSRSKQMSQVGGAHALEAATLVGVDLDGDGRVDTLYAITRYDFDELIRQRQSGESPLSARLEAARFQEGAPDRAQRLEGAVVRTQRFAFEGEPYIIATIRTLDGRTVPVNLGPQSQLRRAEIRRGGSVSVVGAVLIVDGEPMVHARQVRTDRGTFTVDAAGRQSPAALSEPRRERAPMQQMPRRVNRDPWQEQWEPRGTGRPLQQRWERRSPASEEQVGNGGESGEPW